MDATSETDHQLINGAYTIYIHVKESNNLLLCLVSLYLQTTWCNCNKFIEQTDSDVMSSAFHPVCCT